MKKILTILPLLFICAVILLDFSGCTKKSSIPTGQVKGTVTFDGKPLEDGKITFVISGQRDSSAEILNGEIINATTLKSGDGIPIGSAKVSIYSEKIVGTETVKGDDDPTATFTIEKKAPRIPAKYNNIATSGLTCEIVAGENTLKFELKK